MFSTPRYLAIVMEYVAGGDLCDYFIENGLVGVGLPEDLARWFFQQIVLALEFMHKKGVANRCVVRVAHCVLISCSQGPQARKHARGQDNLQATVDQTL